MLLLSAFLTNDLFEIIFTHKFIKNILEQNQENMMSANLNVMNLNKPKKIALIESVNPGWQDLSADWYENPDYSGK